MARIVGMRTVEIKLTEKILLIGQVIEWTSHVTHVVRLTAKQNDQIPKERSSQHQDENGGNFFKGHLKRLERVG